MVLAGTVFPVRSLCLQQPTQNVVAVAALGKSALLLPQA
jgi:hypothetical protein